MNTRFILPLTVLLTLSAVTAQGQQAAPSGANQSSEMKMGSRSHQMGQMMDRMDSMDQAQKADEPKRRKLMQEHMGMMKEQMQAMHGMMARKRGAGRMVPAPGSETEQMQERMDLMQRMMEQMLKQQDLILKSPAR